MLSRSLRLVAVLAVVFAITTQASWFDGSLFGRANVIEGENKQLASVASDILSEASTALFGTGDGATDSSTSSSAPSTSSSAAAATTTSSTTSTSTPPTTTSAPPTETKTKQTTVTSTPDSQTTSPPSTDSSQSSQTSDSSGSITSHTPSVVLVTSVVTESGSVFTSVSSSTDSSSTSKPTSGASLNNNGTTTSSGMSSKTKTTVIGVVVGIGGAIILAGLGVVAWRIWGRKKENDDDDGLMGFRTGSGHEKASSIGNGSAPNPFQSTLESYHGPTKPVNASSNF